MALLPATFRAQRSPNSCGSNIWVASSTIATSKVFRRNISVLDEKVATVPTKTRQPSMHACTSRRVEQASSTFSINRERKEGSQESSLPIRIKSISGVITERVLQISSTARFVYESNNICFPSR